MAVSSKGPAKKGSNPSKPKETKVAQGRKVETPTSTNKGDTEATKRAGGKKGALRSATKSVRK